MKRTLLFLLIMLLSAPCFGIPVSVKDEDGVVFFSVSAPKRIISTMPSNTEILYALGLGKKIIAVSDRCDFPSDAARKKKIGSVSLNAEEIIALNPDLIVMLGSAQRAQIEILRKYKLPVFVIDPRSLEELASSILLLGKITRAENASRKIVWDLNNKIGLIEKTRDPERRPCVFVELWHEPVITAGRGTFISDIISVCGGINIGDKAGEGYPSFSIESLVVEDPDYIIVAGSSSSDIKKISSDRRLAKLSAVRRNRILLIDADIITRPTPRLASALGLIDTFISRGHE